MFEIVAKKTLNPHVVSMDILAPAVAKKALAGQFIILRTHENGERTPFTVADYDRERGTVRIIFQIVGSTTTRLAALNVGDKLQDFVGPLGKATDTKGKKKIAVVGGGVGCAIAYPVAKSFFENGAEVHSIVGFRSSDLIILEEEFKAVSGKFVLMTDDGSAGEKGLVTDALTKLIESGEKYDEVVTIGPIIMMKFVSKVTEKYKIPTVASMSAIMIDGTGMCGCCRVTVGGKTKFACVDGPEFDAHQIDFDEAMSRAGIFKDYEAHKREESCNLFKGTE